jgi:hypothetical protein
MALLLWEQGIMHRNDSERRRRQARVVERRLGSASSPPMQIDFQHPFTQSWYTKIWNMSPLEGLHPYDGADREERPARLSEWPSAWHSFFEDHVESTRLYDSDYTRGQMLERRRHLLFIYPFSTMRQDLQPPMKLRQKRYIHTINQPLRQLQWYKTLQVDATIFLALLPILNRPKVATRFPARACFGCRWEG